MDLEELLAREAIRSLKARYFRSLDEQDWSGLEEVFTNTAHIDTTDDGAPVIEGGEAFVKFLSPILAGVSTVHHGHTHEIRFAGPRQASGIWSMEDRLWFPAEKGGAYLHGFGWYRETYRADAHGVWRIESMKLDRTRVELDGKVIFGDASTDPD